MLSSFTIKFQLNKYCHKSRLSILNIVLHFLKFHNFFSSFHAFLANWAPTNCCGKLGPCKSGPGKLAPGKCCCGKLGPWKIGTLYFIYLYWIYSANNWVIYSDTGYNLPIMGGYILILDIFCQQLANIYDTPQN